MSAAHPAEENAAIHDAIRRVALALDSFLLNGIPYGVIRHDYFPGFLEQRADTLLAELAELERHAPQATADQGAEGREVLASLREACRRLIDEVTGLAAFQTLSAQQLRSAVSALPPLRQECARLLRDLAVLQQGPGATPLPIEVPGGVRDFLAGLALLFEAERKETGVA